MVTLSSFTCLTPLSSLPPLISTGVLSSLQGTLADDPDAVVIRNPSDEEPFSGLAFKIMTDSFVGSLTFVRVYSGVLNAGTYVLNANKGKKERIGRLLEMHANSREDVKTARTGDIVALAGLKVRPNQLWWII